MQDLENRIRQLEIEKLGLQFIVELLLNKLDISTDEMRSFAQKCLTELSKEEKESDMYLYLSGLIKGEDIDQSENQISDEVKSNSS